MVGNGSEHVGPIMGYRDEGLDWASSLEQENPGIYNCNLSVATYEVEEREY